MLARAGSDYDRKQKAETKAEEEQDKGKGNIRRTKRLVAASLFHGAAATKSGAARARIEVANRIVFVIVKKMVLL